MVDVFDPAETLFFDFDDGFNNPDLLPDPPPPPAIINIAPTTSNISASLSEDVTVKNIALKGLDPQGDDLTYAITKQPSRG